MDFTTYEIRIAKRSYSHFLMGLLLRWKTYVKYRCYRRIAIMRGAHIGADTTISLGLALKANSNLSIGSHSSIMTKQLDLRCPIKIGDYVIMGWSVKILTTSHEVDSPEFEIKRCGLDIEDYVWLPAKILVLPSCRHIGYGAVVGSGSCVTRNVDKMSIMGGNPAQEFRKRKQVHCNLIVETLQGSDFIAYKKAWAQRREILNGC